MALNPALLAAIKGAKAKHARGGQTKIVGFKEGKTKIRFLPHPTTHALPFWQDLGIHWIKPEPNAKPLAVVGCHDHTYEKPCPVCMAVDKAAKSTKDDDELKIIGEMKARKQVLVNALVRSGDGASEDPQVVGLTGTTFTALLSIMEEYAEEFGDVLDPNNGMDFIVERTGKGLDTKYSIMPAPKSVAVPKGVLEKCVNLAEFVETEYFGKDTKALNAIAEITGTTVTIGASTAARLTGPKAGTIVDVDHEELPAPKPAARRAAPAVVEEDPPFDTEPEAPKPAARRTAAAKPAPAPADDLGDADVEDILKDLDDL